MRKLILTTLSIALSTVSIHSQTLFKYGSNEVSKQDFLRIYEKNTLNKKPDYTDPALREYLNLYSLFRMKVREAELQHLDTLPNIQRELDNYRKQLAKNYMTDNELATQLITEAYNRMKEEVHVAHILIMVSPTASPEDSMKAYKKIDSLYKAITAKKSTVKFEDVAKTMSDDKGSKENGGDIGFMTTLQTVYPFENMVYATPVGKVSAPFRTQFGYHILKVIEKRPSQGEVKVAQILLSTPKSRGKDGVDEASKKMDTIKMLLRQGVAFDSLVRRYSDDRYSKEEGGAMKPFGVGRTVPVFEKAAFGLKKPGDISDAIQTEYGLHIIKLLEKYPLKPYDSLKDQLKRRIDADSRAQTAHESFIAKIKNKNGFKENKANYDALAEKVKQLPDTGKMANTFKTDDFANMNATLFTLANKDYTQYDFMKFAETMTRGKFMGARMTAFSDLYKLYVDRIASDFEEHRLVEENVEFKFLMEEYRSGIMLFELMDRNVWGKASKDSVGLREFFATRKDKYLWDNGYIGSNYRFKDENSMKEGLKQLAKKDMTDSLLMKTLNTMSTPDAVSIQHGHFEFKNLPDVKPATVLKGKPTEGMKNKDGSYTVIKAEEIFTKPVPKTLEEARGYVVAEYQDYLEKKWNEVLRAKYPFVLNEEVYRTIKK